MGIRLQVVEPGGRGGVHQHAVAMALLLAKEGVAVRLHTAADHERLVSAENIYCTCFDWKRDSSVRTRRAKILFSYFFKFLPHLLSSRTEITWFQGGFKPLLTLIAIALLRMTRSTVFFSPHNLFSRKKSPKEQRLIRLSCRLSSEVVLYNTADMAIATSWGLRAGLIPLVQFVPNVPAATMERIRRELPREPFVCFAGQIRKDKNLPLVNKRAAEAGMPLVVVGADVDGLTEAVEVWRRSDAHITWFVGYADLSDLTFIVQQSIAVVCPYEVASQSGVAALARTVRTTVIGTSAGGLTEQVDVQLKDLTTHEIARCLRQVTRANCSNPLSSETGRLPARDDSVFLDLFVQKMKETQES